MNTLRSARRLSWARVLCWSALALFVSEVPPLRAQGVVHAAAFTADLTGSSASVRVAYALRGLAPGSRVGVSSLDFGAAAVTAVRVGIDGASVAMVRATGARRVATVTVARGRDGDSELTLRYDVPLPAGGDARVVNIPVVTVDLAPERARAALFDAVLQVPPTWSVTEGFPTAMTKSGDTGAYRATLQVVPRVITVRANTDGETHLGIVQLLDVTAIAALLGFAAVGWRTLSRRAT